MFSGIVEECARVTGIVKEQENVHFTLQCSFVDELKIDQSVAHNGVCLTVVRIQDGWKVQPLSAVLSNRIVPLHGLLCNYSHPVH